MIFFLARLVLAASFAVGALAPALAQVSPDCGKKPEASTETGFWERDRLAGDWGGARQRLQDAGIVLGLTDQNEFWANMSGGARRGVSYVGLTTMGLTIDPAKATDPSKAIGWQGMCIFVSAYQIRGRGPSSNLVGALQAVSSLEATRATRLYDLWLEQSLFDGAFSVRLGQGGANTEFMLTQYGGLFVNSTFGFPMLAALDLPSGAPNYPLATPFVRLKWSPNKTLTLLGAVFNGDPAGPGTNDPQLRNGSGTLFRTNDGALVVIEAQISLSLPLPAGDLPGTYKLGGWVHTGRFNDQAFDRSGISLAAPGSDGVARRHGGNQGIYGGFDQLIWRPAGTKEDDPRGIGLFAMLTSAPTDRNLIDFSANAGANWKGPFAGREADSFGIAVAYAHVSPRAQRLGQDAVLFTGTGQRFHATEVVFEATYAAQVAGWWVVQPSLQYVVHPGAGIPSATSPARRHLPDAAVFGLRSSIAF